MSGINNDNPNIQIQPFETLKEAKSSYSNSPVLESISNTAIKALKNIQNVLPEKKIKGHLIKKSQPSSRVSEVGGEPSNFRSIKLILNGNKTKIGGMGHPRRFNRNRQLKELLTTITQKFKFTTLISLDHEHEAIGDEWKSLNGKTSHCAIVVKDFKPITQEQFDELYSIVKSKNGEPVMIHCAEGFGRTGTMMASLALRHLFDSSSKKIMKNKFEMTSKIYLGEHAGKKYVKVTPLVKQAINLIRKKSVSSKNVQAEHSVETESQVASLVLLELELRRRQGAIPSESDKSLEEKLNQIAGFDEQYRLNVALFEAVETGNKTEVKKLLAQGAHVFQTNVKGKSPEEVAKENNHITISKLLTEKRDHISFILKAIDENTPQELKKIALNKSNINQVDKNGFTLLQNAVLIGNKEFVEILLDNGAKIDLAGEEGGTPLQLAAQYGNKDITDTLLKKGAKIDLADEEGTTPLQFAIKNGETNLVRTLIAYGADINKADDEGMTPLLLAIEDGVNIDKTLIDAGADIRKVNFEGETSLQLAVMKGKLEITKLLLNKGGDINQKNSEGESLLQLAARKGRLDVIKFLLEKVVKVDLKNDVMVANLFRAALRGKADVVEALIKAGVDVNSTKGTETPLIGASKKGYVHVVNTLLKNKADINLTKKDGATPLMEATRAGHLLVIKTLLENCSKDYISLKDNNGNTALSLAKKNGIDEIIDLINTALGIEI